jgi:hypothetical protein
MILLCHRSRIARLKGTVCSFARPDSACALPTLAIMGNASPTLHWALIESCGLPQVLQNQGFVQAPN